MNVFQSRQIGKFLVHTIEPVAKGITQYAAKFLRVPKYFLQIQSQLEKLQDEFNSPQAPQIKLHLTLAELRGILGKQIVAIINL